MYNVKVSTTLLCEDFMKKLGIGSVLEINEDFVKVENILTKCDSDGFHRHYIKFENDPDPVDIRDFETCKYNVVSV
jgi:hypothetical protein